MNAIETKHLTRAFGSLVAVDDLTLAIPEGTQWRGQIQNPALVQAGTQIRAMEPISHSLEAVYLELVENER